MFVNVTAELASWDQALFRIYSDIYIYIYIYFFLLLFFLMINSFVLLVFRGWVWSNTENELQLFYSAADMGLMSELQIASFGPSNHFPSQEVRLVNKLLKESSHTTCWQFLNISYHRVALLWQKRSAARHWNQSETVTESQPCLIKFSHDPSVTHSSQGANLWLVCLQLGSFFE